VRVLGLDLGRRRIGLALSDAAGVFAFPEGALVRSDARRDLEALCALCEERGVERIVVGLPLHMNGREGNEAAAARRFASALEERSGRPVELLDERWTSVEAERALRATGGRPSRRRGQVDAVAATLILRTWLARQAGAEAAAR